MSMARLLCVFFLIVFFRHSLHSQPPEYFQKQAMILKRAIEKNHYSPRTVDDSFSLQVFNRFMERLDDDKLIFLKIDIDQLSSYRFQIDDELMGRSWNFLPAISSLYKSRLLMDDSLIRSITDKAFDFTIQENFSLKADTQYARTNQEYESRWRKWLKYETMMKIYDMNLTSSKEFTGKSFTKFEEDARTKIKNMELR